jgi:hypothetical protein
MLKIVQNFTEMNIVGNCKMLSIIIIKYYWTAVVYAVLRWWKRRYAARTCIVLHRVLCSQNVFHVRAQMLMKVNDTHFFILLCMYGRSQYINSRTLTDCMNGVNIGRGEMWGSAVLGYYINCRKIFCWIFDSRYVEVRIKVLQEIEILTICEFSVKLFTSIRKVRQTTNGI